MSAERYLYGTHHQDGVGQESIPLRDRDVEDSTEQSHPTANLPTLQQARRSSSTSDPDQASANLEPNHLASHEKRAGLGHSRSGEVKRHVLILWLLFLYALIAILSWTITCVLCFHPAGGSTWYDQAGNYSSSVYQKSDRLRRAASVGFSAISAIGIPTTSAIAARAAAVYCQRNFDKKTPPLTLRQMLALADKGWSGFEYIRDLFFRPSKSRRFLTPLQVFAMVLVVLAFLIPILQTAFVSTEHILVWTNHDRFYYNHKAVANLVPPSEIINTPNSAVMINIISDTVTGKIGDGQPNLWASGSGAVNITSIDATLAPGVDASANQTSARDYFTSAVPVGTDTGVLRNLATRMGTFVKCELVPQTQFPTSCSGGHPFERKLSNIDDDSDPTPFGHALHPRYKGRICAPGYMTRSPWNDTSDRQEIHEDLWIDFQFSNMSLLAQNGGYPPSLGNRANFTQHCYSSTTLGYFEVPNYWNGHQIGKLLDKIPPNSKNVTYCNRYNALDEGTKYSSKSVGVPGPLLTSALAIFGPNTFFDLVASPLNNNITSFSDLSLAFCSQLRYPFSGLTGWDTGVGNVECSPSDDDVSGADGSTRVPDLQQAVLTWLPNFGDPAGATAALTKTAYAVPKYLFAQTLFTPTSIISSPGRAHEKPTMPMPAMVLITLLLAVQILGLAFLAIYSCSKPAWTETLDALAMVRIGAEVAAGAAEIHDLPGGVRLGSSKKELAGLLDRTAGWVGVAGDIREEGGAEDAEMDKRRSEALPDLCLGGSKALRKGKVC